MIKRYLFLWLKIKRKLRFYVNKSTNVNFFPGKKGRLVKSPEKRNAIQFSKYIFIYKYLVCYQKVQKIKLIRFLLKYSAVV